jgi:hypothetical protein
VAGYAKDEVLVVLLEVAIKMISNYLDRSGLQSLAMQLEAAPIQFDDQMIPGPQ